MCQSDHGERPAGTESGREAVMSRGRDRLEDRPTTHTESTSSTSVPGENILTRLLLSFPQVECHTLNVLSGHFIFKQLLECNFCPNILLELYINI